MKWLFSGLTLAALLSITGQSATAAPEAVTSPRADDRCTASDVQRIAHHFYDFGSDWTEDGSPEAIYAAHLFEDCQFRFYDNNDPEDNPNSPEIPHVFSQGGYFLGGIANWFTASEFEAEGLTESEAVALMKTWTDRVFWGPATATDAELKEIKVATTPYGDAFLDEDDPLAGKHSSVGNHRYVIFKANTLEPGDYRWRWERAAGGATYVFYGAVTVTP
ncbi:hypothetical protein E3T55_17230 [Cryobacterium frigoriphilum]|uniref:Tat pathway signal sequence domain protein n=1 Tax=Cryobacterium frigoriphilum TaxID=1259150 RepID=A0A4R8ZUP8_9MICO|nr:hypothetical protein [Cryobacterium frigoriphilum]TFD46355.1 hypothetical protein E3T55_17230 [Cryobacterium frigoriphilum]